MGDWTPDGKTRVTGEEIVAGLREIGLQAGDLVQVHSALSAFGYVEGGPDAVVDALLEVLGPEGTLMVPTFNHGSVEVFDVATSPSVSGKITEAVRARPGAHRSVHPTHPYAAIGPLAEWLTSEHLDIGTFDWESPLGKLTQRDGLILMLGAGFNSNTIVHIAEVKFGVRCIGVREHPRRVRMPDGTIIEAWGARWRNGKCQVEWEPIESEMRARGMIRDGRIGDARPMLMRARDAFDVTYELCQKICPTCEVRPIEVE